MSSLVLATALSISLLTCSGGSGPPCVQSVQIGFPQLAAEGTCCPGVTWPSPTACTLTCVEGRTDCDLDLNVTNANGCETDLTSDTNNCGSCGNACEKPCGGCLLGQCSIYLALRLPAGARCPVECGWCAPPLQCSKLVGLTQKACCVPDGVSGPKPLCTKDADCCSDGSRCKQNGTCGQCLLFNSKCSGAGDACAGWECVNNRLCAKDGTICTDGECCSYQNGGACAPVFTCPNGPGTQPESTQSKCVPKDCGVKGSKCPLFSCCEGLKCTDGTCGC